VDAWVAIVCGAMFLVLVCVLVGLGLTTKGQHQRGQRLAEAQRHITAEWKRLDEERKRRKQDPPEDL
jgi:hypothetical protein